VESPFFISSRTGDGSSHVFEMLPAISCISWACALRAGDYASIFFSGPVEAVERHSCTVSTGWLFWNIIAHPLLGEEDSTSSPCWLRSAARIAVHEVGESPPNTRRSRPSLNNYPSLCATLDIARGVGELYQRRSTLLCNRYTVQPLLHQDWGRARTAGNRFARDDKELGPQLGETITLRTAS
jgi:hypothetical protein